MKAGEIYKATVPGEPHVDGHKYKLVRQEKRWPSGDVWVTTDVDTGEERCWTQGHFETVLAKV